MRVLIILLLLSVIGNTDLLQFEAQACLPSRLEIGSEARVTPGAANRIRSESNIGSEQIGQIPAGDVVTVLDGPECTDGFLWWRVSYDNITGWTVEGNDTAYFLEPYPAEGAVTVTDTDTCDQESRLNIADFGQVSSDVPSRLRAAPGISAEQVGQVNLTDVFVVVDGPVCADGFHWWQVEVNNLLGWLAEGDGETYFVEVVTDPSLISTATPQPELIVYDASWNADSTRFTVATSIGVLIYDTANWSQHPRILDNGILADNLVYSPTNPEILIINHADIYPTFKFRAYLLSDEGETILFERALLDGPMGGERPADNFAFSGDGGLLGFGGSSFDVIETENWARVNDLEITEEAGNHYVRIRIIPSDLNSTGDYGAGIVDGGIVQLYDLTLPKTTDLGEEDPRISILDRGGRTQDITAIEFSPDDTYLLTGDETGSLQMWELESGERTSFIRAENQTSQSNRINDVAFHPNGDEIATAESEPHGIIRIFTTEALEPGIVFTSDENHRIADVASYSPNGDTLATIMDDVIYLLETTHYTVIDQIVITQP